MAEQWNIQYTQYPSLGGNQTYLPSSSTPAHFGSNAGHVGMAGGAAAYPYAGDPSSGHFQSNYPRDNLPARRLNDLAQLGHVQGSYHQVPGSHGQPRTEWRGINQGAQYPAVTSLVPGTAIPGGAGVPGGGYFGPGAESMTITPSNSSNPTVTFGDEPNFLEIPVTADGKRYRCECGHETKTAGDMTRHHETSKHSGARYACPCGKRYFRKDGLTRHERTCPKRNV